MKSLKISIAAFLGLYLMMPLMVMASDEPIDNKIMDHEESIDDKDKLDNDKMMDKDKISDMAK